MSSLWCRTRWLLGAVLPAALVAMLLGCVALPSGVRPTSSAELSVMPMERAEVMYGAREVTAATGLPLDDAVEVAVAEAVARQELIWSTRDAYSVSASTDPGDVEVRRVIPVLAADEPTSTFRPPSNRDASIWLVLLGRSGGQSAGLLLAEDEDAWMMAVDPTMNADVSFRVNPALARLDDPDTELAVIPVWSGPDGLLWLSVEQGSDAYVVPFSYTYTSGAVTLQGAPFRIGHRYDSNALTEPLVRTDR